MSEREKLIQLIGKVNCLPLNTLVERIADYLIANGATVPVRCDECIHGKVTFLTPDRETVMCCVSGNCVDLNFYCACGERKDNGT